MINDTLKKDRRRTLSYMYDMLKIDKSSVKWG